MTKYTLLKNKVTGERSIRLNVNGVLITEKDNPTEYNELRKKALASLQRKQKDSLMESLGLTKVYGAVSGKVYYE